MQPHYHPCDIRRHLQAREMTDRLLAAARRAALGIAFLAALILAAYWL